MADIQVKKENSKDGLALIVGGLFILALVFATYNYFNKSSKKSDLEKIQQETVFEEGVDGKTPSANINGNGAKTEKVDANVDVSKLGKGGPITPTTAEAQWTANDYKSGDIKGASYTVKSGDTLWEIAEAAYGNGAEWTKILDANKSSIGLLADGSQALIRPGQVLVLP
jgi:nucleoid-associated protein YgaU